jgi:hypothetical protein
MRILFDNLIDGLAVSRISALTEDPLYEASRVQDQRLTTRWHTTAASDQTILFSGSCDTIVGGNIGLVTGSSATNLITDPENLTSGNWVKSSVLVATVDSIIGYPAYSVVATSTGSSIYPANAIVATTSQCVSIILRKYTSNLAYVYLYNSSVPTTIGSISLNFDAKTATFAGSGTQVIPPQWIDDQTVRLFMKGASVSVGNSIRAIVWPTASATGSTGTIISAPMLIDNPFPVPYVATSRSAVSTSYNFRPPPSGKFIIDCEFFPFFNYDIPSTTRYIGGWYGTSQEQLAAYYLPSSDTFKILYKDNGTVQVLESERYDNGASYRNLNTRIRLTVSLDISSQDKNGSMLIMNGIIDDAAWSDIPDLLTCSSMTTMEVGLLNNSQYFDGIVRFARVYGGVFTSAQSSITTEAELDAALAKHTLLFDQTYQRRFDFDTVAILGHNISEGAAIKMEANDFPEWNYVDGSGSSIIQHSLTWDDETILKMITATKKQYVKFTINDPNNDDGVLKIGRFWIGRYLDIDPASLDNFTVTKKRTDDVAYGVNMQKFAAVGTKYREFDFKFPPTNSTMVTAIQTMYDHVGNHSSVIFCNFNLIRDYTIVEPCYCSIVGDISFSHKGRQKYEYGLRLSENK